MALIQCPECGGKVSSTAKTCPGCGFSVAKYVRKLVREAARIERLSEIQMRDRIREEEVKERELEHRKKQEAQQRDWTRAAWQEWNAQQEWDSQSGEQEKQD